MPDNVISHIWAKTRLGMSRLSAGGEDPGQAEPVIKVSGKPGREQMGDYGSIEKINKKADEKDEDYAQSYGQGLFQISGGI